MSAVSEPSTQSLLKEVAKGVLARASRDPSLLRGADQGRNMVRVGDIVLVHCEDCPRGIWRLGKVVELATGPDGLTKMAIVQVH